MTSATGTVETRHREFREAVEAWNRHMARFLPVVGDPIPGPTAADSAEERRLYEEMLARHRSWVEAYLKS